MNNLINYINTNRFGSLFMFFGIMLQVFSFYYTSSSIISVISGITGILSVVLCAQRKISFYIFAWIQLFTYVYLCIQQNLYGEIVENIFYAITMIYGMYIWNKNRDIKDTTKVEPKKLQFSILSIIYFIGSIFVLGVWYLLKLTNDSQPFIDSISTVPAFIAQVLMILAYREQWYFWLIIDIASIVMWWIAGDMNMVCQFIFWTINCIYGLKQWNKN